MTSMKKFQSGLSLIELIIIVAFVSALVFIGSKVINPFIEIQRNNDEIRKKDLAKIQQGIENYYQQFGVYPSNPDTHDFRIKGFKTDHPVIDWGEDWKPFVDILPKDPAFPSKKYVYYSTYDGQVYYLYASLDRGSNDSDACKKDGSKCTNAPDLPDKKNACGGVCNYGVSSRNVTP